MIVAQRFFYTVAYFLRAQFIDLIKRPSSRFPKRSARLIITDVEDEKRFAPVNLVFDRRK